MVEAKTSESKLELGAGRKTESVKAYLESKVYPILQTALLDVSSFFMKTQGHKK